MGDAAPSFRIAIPGIHRQMIFKFLQVGAEARKLRGLGSSRIVTYAS
jgi:hypothetical protein